MAKNPAPVELGRLCHYLGGFIHTSQVVQDFFHQQYHINSGFQKAMEHTVDGRNPAPPGMYKTLLNTVIFTIISTGFCRISEPSTVAPWIRLM